MDDSIITLSIPQEHIINVFGQFDSNVKKIEKKLSVSFIDRDGEIRITGDNDNIHIAQGIINELVSISKGVSVITQQEVNYLLSLPTNDVKNHSTSEARGSIICHTTSGKPVTPKTIGQRKYVEAIQDKMIVFGVGPAGTGKTYLAMAMALTAFKNEEVSRIILTRPAIEAGEKLGFLPGDLQSKVDPYLRPLYDALYQIMGAEAFQRNMEKGLIEVAPLAYMRGRTLDNSFIILDEAQNTTPAQMKMFLTRIGFGSKAVITGDATQKDLPSGQASGLDEAMKVLKNIDDIAICNLTGQDVVRHPLVQQIVSAYELFEKQQKKKQDNKSKSRRPNDAKNK